MMDFLDPKKRRGHTIRLFIGYGLLAALVVMGVNILLYSANGFSLNKGKVIQNGLVFVSSRPGNASVYLNGLLKDSTSARLFLPAGTYAMRLQKAGYRTWQRGVTVRGGGLERIDYPFMVPSKLSSGTLVSYAAQPRLASQSPDRRWLVMQPADEPLGSFVVYDLKDPKKVTATDKTAALPANVLTQGTNSSLRDVEWSNDNRHVLLQHTYAGGSEYILFDRQEPAASRNLSAEFSLAATAQVSLQNKQADHFFVYDTAKQTLGTAELGTPAVKPLLTGVLQFKTYNDDTVLYATLQDADPDQTRIMLYQNGTNYPVRTLPRDSKYLLNLARYDSNWYIAAGVPSDNRVYVYKNPVAALGRAPTMPLVPTAVLKVRQPSYVQFSASTQYLMAANATSFAIYDAEYDKSYAYTEPAALDAPQQHAVWMNSDHIAYVSGGRLIMFDYDGTNRQTLAVSTTGASQDQTTANGMLAFFDRDYKYLYSVGVLGGGTEKTPGLLSTPLLTPDDL